MTYNQKRSRCIIFSLLMGLLVLGSYEKLTARIDSPESLSNYESFGSVMATNGSMLAVAMRDEVCIYRYETNGTISLLNRIENPATSSSNNYFGQSIAFSGNFLAIGAPGSSSRMGAVYLYKILSDGSSVSLSTLTSPSSQFDLFGTSVSMDQGILCIGAPLDDYAPGTTKIDSDAGSAYVYKLDSAGNTYLLGGGMYTDGQHNYGITTSVVANKIIIASAGQIFLWE